jgi:MSHA pilin protein MshD
VGLVPIRQRSASQSGATLVEMVISIAVVGICVAGVLLAMLTTTARSADPMLQHQASAVAEAYLEEILLRDYLDPDTSSVCPAPEATRDLYDNVCDYALLDDAGARSQDGTPVAGLGDYRVRVGVDGAATLGGLSGSADVLRVDVRVTHPTGLDLTLSGYRTRY